MHNLLRHAQILVYSQKLVINMFDLGGYPFFFIDFKYFKLSVTTSVSLFFKLRTIKTIRRDKRIRPIRQKKKCKYSYAQQC